MALLLGMLQKTPEQHGIFKRTCVIKRDCSNVFYLMSYSCCQKICVRVCALLVLSYNMVNSQVPAKLLHSMHHVFFFFPVSQSGLCLFPKYPHICCPYSSQHFSENMSTLVLSLQNWKNRCSTHCSGSATNACDLLSPCDSDSPAGAVWQEWSAWYGVFTPPFKCRAGYIILCLLISRSP